MSIETIGFDQSQIKEKFSSFTIEPFFMDYENHCELWLDILKQVDKIALDEEAKYLRSIYQSIEDSLVFVSKDYRFNYVGYRKDTMKYCNYFKKMLVNRGYNPDELVGKWYTNTWTEREVNPTLIEMMAILSVYGTIGEAKKME